MRNIFILSSVFIFFAFSCDKKNNNNNNNNGSNQVNAVVNIYIYKNTPEFFSLQVPGGWMYKQGGNCGVIIYRIDQNENNDDFVAFERNCPFFLCVYVVFLFCFMVIFIKPPSHLYQNVIER